MKIELKSLKVHKELSEETIAYTATVWINNERAFTAHNRGFGACDSYDLIMIGGDFERSRQLMKRAEEYAATQTRENFEGKTVPCDLEDIIQRKLYIAMTTNDVKREMRTRWLLHLPAEHEQGQFVYIKKAKGKEAEQKKAIDERYPDAIIAQDNFDAFLATQII